MGWKKDNVIFNSGTCYALSRQTIKNIGKYMQYLPTVHPPPNTEHCVDREGAGEDPQMGACLAGVGIRPGNTVDHELRERFLIFRDTDHVIMFREICGIGSIEYMVLQMDQNVAVRMLYPCIIIKNDMDTRNVSKSFMN